MKIATLEKIHELLKAEAKTPPLQKGVSTGNSRPVLTMTG